MSNLKRKMYKAMQDSKWWPVGDESIEDMTEIAMKVTSEYTDNINEILLSGLDSPAKIESIKLMHENFTGN